MFRRPHAVSSGRYGFFGDRHSVDEEHEERAGFGCREMMPTQTYVGDVRACDPNPRRAFRHESESEMSFAGDVEAPPYGMVVCEMVDEVAARLVGNELGPQLDREILGCPDNLLFRFHESIEVEVQGVIGRPVAGGGVGRLRYGRRPGLGCGPAYRRRGRVRRVGRGRGSGLFDLTRLRKAPGGERDQERGKLARLSSCLVRTRPRMMVRSSGSDT